MTKIKQKLVHYYLQNEETQEITFYLKGADVVMTSIVQYNDWLNEECGNLAREGLRTLVVAKKSLTTEQYNDFEVNHLILNGSFGINMNRNQHEMKMDD